MVVLPVFVGAPHVRQGRHGHGPSVDVLGTSGKELGLFLLALSRHGLRGRSGHNKLTMLLERATGLRCRPFALAFCLERATGLHTAGHNHTIYTYQSIGRATHWPAVPAVPYN